MAGWTNETRSAAWTLETRTLHAKASSSARTEVVLAERSSNEASHVLIVIKGREVGILTDHGSKLAEIASGTGDALRF